ncbi:MAG: twin-arginine translocation signal domain-containing protein [Phycisphaerales bacterium]|nr:MAG: twin-arginine translocation signal domain-containing protein [Phycisphaerales bacterium]
MCLCHDHSLCHSCNQAIDRRRFIKGFGAAAATAVAGLTSLPTAAKDTGKVRVATVFLANTQIREIWPYPGFDTEGRQRQVLGLLEQGCPEIEFTPLTIRNANEVQKAIALKDAVDGYLVYAMTLDWAFGQPIIEIGNLGRPMMLVDEFLGGSGVFLTAYSGLCRRGIPAAAVSTTRLSDLVTVAREFTSVRKRGVTPASFARQCEQVYRKTFAPAGKTECIEDRVTLADIGECVRRFQEARFLIVGQGSGGQERDLLGATGRYIDFGELQAFYDKVDRDEAAEWAGRWRRQAAEVMEPDPSAIHKAGAVYLATLELLRKYGTDSVTMNCLGGFAAGQLAAYPCLGFMQILNDGGQGVCEAMPDDTLSMLMARILTGRPGYVSDPALDTSKNKIVYAHCVATTKVFGPGGISNSFRIRTLHNRDPRGACSESMLPAGYMTTSFRTNFGQKKMIIHQAKAVGTLDSEYGCRTKLVAEVHGDIGKLFDQWDRFGWHRVTVYGDVKEPLVEFGKALGLQIVEEA